MSQRAFQAMAGLIVVDADFRERVVRFGADALEADLTPLERQRLLALAADPGLEPTRLVHKDFRLSKLYIMLPLTRFMLGRERMLREAHGFWSENLPVTHYFLPEAFGFCDYLQKRLRSGRLRVKYLSEVISYERAELELKRPRPDGQTPPPQLVRFQHDPFSLLSSLAQGRRPRAVPALPRTLVATLNPEGNVQWNLHEGEAAHLHEGEAERA